MRLHDVRRPKLSFYPKIPRPYVAFNEMHAGTYPDQKYRILPKEETQGQIDHMTYQHVGLRVLQRETTSTPGQIQDALCPNHASMLVASAR